MISTTHNPNGAVASSIQLVIERSDGGAFTHVVKSGEGAIAGSDRTCSLHLEGDGVASLHCMIRYTNGEIRVQDWYSETGTFVNGERIHAETTVPAGAAIRVGSFTIRADQGEPREERGGNREERGETHAGVSPLAPPSSLLNCPPPSTLLISHDDFTEACDPLTFSLLQTEVEQLQNELAERDARLAEFESLVNEQTQTGAAEESVDAAETAALVDRLEQLLDELSQSDERVSTAEDLLRLAEDANEAEREERRQIEAWVNDIEQKIGRREAEWAAELDALRRRIAEVTKERDQSDRRLEQSGSAQDAQRELQGVIETLRRQSEERQLQLDESREEKTRLEAQLQSVGEEQSAVILQEKVDEAMREERLEFAREAATLARQRAEMSRLKDELKREREKKSHSKNDVDGKFQAFRDHLKDVHEQEQQQRKERSLSARLSRLWKRLEGRAT